MDESDGPITAIDVMDDRMVVFKDRRILIVEGDGPDDVRARGGSWGLAQEVSTDVGCVGPAAVFPDGLAFWSRQGARLLDRGLQVVDIGGPVTLHSGLDVVSIEVIPDLDEVRFLSTDGECLVLNHYYRRWSTFDNYASADAVVVGNVYHRLDPRGRVLMDSPTVFTDGGSPYSRVVELPWVVPGGAMCSRSKCKLFHVKGDFRSHHRMRVSIAYNFRDEFVSARTFDTTLSGSIVGVGYGSGSYGEGPYGGGSDLTYDFRFRPRFLSARAYRLRFEDLPAIGSQDQYGESAELSEIALDVKVYQNLRYRRTRIV